MLCGEVGRGHECVNIVVCTTTVRSRRVKDPYVAARCCLDDGSFVPVHLRLLLPSLYRNVLSTALCHLLISVGFCQPGEQCF